MSAATPRSGSPTARPVLLLAGTELWERFTYYALRSMLVLHLVAAPAAGGFALSEREATAYYGLFVAAVYLAALPGGSLADRVVGPVRAVWLGASALVAGNVVLALAPTLGVFALGLVLVASGVGLLKPNVTALVARAARREGRSLDAAFTVFYVGINVGGIGGPLLASALAARFGWGAGYAVGAAGMLLGMLAFRPIAGALAEPTDVRTSVPPRALAMALAAVAALAICLVLVPAPQLVQGAFVLVAAAALAGFVVLHRASIDDGERRNVRLLAVLFVGATVFWAAGEQAGASLTLLADRFTDRTVAGRELPAPWFQALYPGFVVLLAPAFAIAWTRLGHRQRDPSSLAKFAAGLLFAAGALALAAVAARTAGGGVASPAWLVGTYLLLALGEILLSPIGLGAATRYAPARSAGFATGLWFLSLSLGGLLAGLTGSLFDLGTASGLQHAFIGIAATLAAAGTIFAIVARRRPSGA